MNFVEFAPNENKQDALLAIKMLFQPWRFAKGKEITKLRQRLRKRFFSDKAEVYLFLTGRSALYYFLKSLNLPKGTKVLVQGFTCEAVVLPILAQELNPVYVDINKEDLSMNIEDLKKKYSPQAKVLILQHSFGITPKNRKEMLQFAKDKQLTVLEDLAHGFDLDLFNNKNITSSLLLSFGRSKSISGVFGGAIVTKYKRISDYLTEVEKTLTYPSTWFMFKMVLYKAQSVLIKSLYNIYIGRIIHALSIFFNLFIPEISKREKNGEYDPLFAKKLPNIAAIFILQQLNRFNDVLRQKKEISKYFTDKLRQSKFYNQAYIRYPYIAEDKKFIVKKAKRNNMYLGTWYEQVVAPKALSLAKVDYKKGSCPVAESVCSHIVNLPTFISKKDAQKIVKIIKNI